MSIRLTRIKKILVGRCCEKNSSNRVRKCANNHDHRVFNSQQSTHQWSPNEHCCGAENHQQFKVLPFFLQRNDVPTFSYKYWWIIMFNIHYVSNNNYRPKFENKNLTQFTFFPVFIVNNNFVLRARFLSGKKFSFSINIATVIFF